MNKIVITVISLILSIMIIGCSKKAPVDPPEDDLKLSTNPTIGSNIIGALSDTYGFKLLINSKPPKSGVKIEVSVKNDLNNAVSFTQTLQTASNSINSIDIQLSNILLGNLFTTTIDVTSLNKPSNKAQLVFKIARK